jgi:hypothetical protein
MACARRAGSWDRAGRCFQAMALGVADKSILALATDNKAAYPASGLDHPHSECQGGGALALRCGRWRVSFLLRCTVQQFDVW